MVSEDSDVDRRSFLKLAGSTAVAASVAGCGGGGGDGTDTPAEDGETPTATPEQGTEPQGTPEQTATPGDETATPADETATPEPLPEDFPVTVTQGQMPTTLDPHDHRDIPTDTVMRQVYEGLIARNRAGEVIPMLATEWERVEEGLVRFTIREGPTFQQTGNELTPEDVAYTINRIVKNDVGFASPQKGQLAGVTGAEVGDGRVVEVSSSGLNPTVFSKFANYCDVMEKQWVQDNERSHIAQNMNGTGPFVQTDYEQNVRVVMERNDDYWQRPPAVTELTFNAASESSARVNQLIAGETDIVVNVPPQQISRVNSEQNTTVAATGSTRIIYNAMRYDVEPFSSPDFRRAMNYAIDLESIVEDVLQTFGAQTAQPTLEHFFGHDPELEPYPHDPAQAEQLVEESGHSGASITLHTPVGRYLKDVEIAQAVANMIDQLENVSCEVKQREFSTLAGELTDGDITTGPDFYLIGWGNATFDASQTIVPCLTSDGQVTSYKNEELDSLITEANQTGDTEERDSILQEANTHCHEQAPWIFLNRQYSVYGISTGVNWQPRSDERIDAYSITPADG